MKLNKGQSLVELLLAVGLAAVLLPALLTGFVTTREGKPQQSQRILAESLLRTDAEALRSIRNRGWSNIIPTGTYHPIISSNQWTLAPSPAQPDSNGLTQSITITNVYRRATDSAIISSGGNLDPSTKQVDLAVSWTQPFASSIQSTIYLTRYRDNLAYIQTTQNDFLTPSPPYPAPTLNNTAVVNNLGGEVQLANNNKAKWCSPSLSSATINLPDGPPIAVSATASATTTSTPNDVFVATSPYSTNSAKMVYVNVTANTDPPIPSIKGTFTMNPSAYSSPSYFPSGTGLDNTFITTDIKYYKAPSGKLYALLTTNRSDKEVLVIQINNGSGDAYQDPTNHIYKYWTFFNTRQYQGDSRSTPNQDQAPFGYGAVALSIFGSRGYIASGGYLYVFDLSNIDSKSPSNGLDMVGCRIQLDGYDCQPGSGTDMKYNSGQTGTSWGDTTSPAHNNCSDGGNIELYADHQLSAVKVNGSTYIYIAVGAGTDPELDIANVTNDPTSSTSPKISNSSCGRISGGNSGWKTGGSLDFNPYSGTEEAANSVYAKSDGTRAYMSSNGGIDPNKRGVTDSDQFYVIDTSSKTSPKFLSSWSSTQFNPPAPTPPHYANTAQTGYYNGDSTNIQLFPRRALTVLNGQRAILVGQDGYPNDSIEPKEYQVLKIDNETTPIYCGGINFLPGFNDLTSVTEADFDNFVYMVANTQEKQLKIIQGGPDGTYVDQGIYESAIFDAGYDVTFNRFFATTTIPAQTSLQYQFAIAEAVGGNCTGANYVFTGPDGNTNTYYPVSATGSAILLNNDGVGYENPGRCLKYRTYMSSTDYNATPVLQDITINYSP